MPTDDVVAELDAELALIEPLPYRVPIHYLAKRARDEIVALRFTAERRLSMVQDANRCIEETQALLVAVRDEALEEAARVCERAERRFRDGLQWEIEADLVAKNAAAIRALKGQAAR